MYAAEGVPTYVRTYMYVSTTFVYRQVAVVGR